MFPLQFQKARLDMIRLENMVGVAYSVAPVLCSLHSLVSTRYRLLPRKQKIRNAICLSGYLDHWSCVRSYTYSFLMSSRVSPTGLNSNLLVRKHRLPMRLKLI